jgi:hypothetical protein
MTELVEFGSIILHKRNTEMKLFIKIKNKPTAGSDDSIHEDLTPEIILLQTRIAEYDRDLGEIDLKPTTTENENITRDIALTIEKLEQLRQLYQTFLVSVHDEKKVLNIDDIDFLDDIIRQKDDILNQIDDTRKDIDFDSFKKISRNDENISKANEILSDIHSIIDEIIRVEDENRVELQSLSEKMKLDIKIQDRGAKAISQYSQSNVKSHFIDTKK